MSARRLLLSSSSSPFHSYTVLSLVSLVLSLLSLSSLCNAELVNITVDDSWPAALTGKTISYSSEWQDGPSCTDCWAAPDARLARNGTWHDATFGPPQSPQTATLMFTGTTSPLFSSVFHPLISTRLYATGSALYVYVILAPDSAHAGLTADSNMFFTLDGKSVGAFSLNASSYNDYQYNYAAYSNPSIGNGDHTFILQNGQEGATNSLILLDYMVYS